MSMTDEECWARLQDSCKKSLETLYFRYYDKLYSYAVSFCGSQELAEDHIQSLFLKIWEKRQSLAHVEYVKTYLWVCLRRSLIDERRKEKRFQQNAIIRENENFRIISSPEEIILTKESDLEIRKNLYDAIDALHPRQQEVLYLKFFEGMSYKEIEEITSLQYQSVRNYIYEAVKTLKSILQKKNNHPSVQLNPAVLPGLLMLLTLSV